MNGWHQGARLRYGQRLGEKERQHLQRLLRDRIGAKHTSAVTNGETIATRVHVRRRAASQVNEKAHA